MYRVAILGPESSGKSTLGRYLAERYRFVTYVPEYGRSYLEEHGTDYDYTDVETIARQVAERMAHPERETGEVVVYDTELVYMRVWMDEVYGRHPEWLDRAIGESLPDCYLLTRPDLPWQPDPTRENGSDERRKYLFETYRKAIEDLSVPYYIVEHITGIC